MMGVAICISADDARLPLNLSGKDTPTEIALRPLFLMITLVPQFCVQPIVYSIPPWQRPKVFISALVTHASGADFATVNAHGEVFKILGFSTGPADSCVHATAPKLRPERKVKRGEN